MYTHNRIASVLTGIFGIVFLIFYVRFLIACPAGTVDQIADAEIFENLLIDVYRLLLIAGAGCALSVLLNMGFRRLIGIAGILFILSVTWDSIDLNIKIMTAAAGAFMIGGLLAATFDKRPYQLNLSGELGWLLDIHLNFRSIENIGMIVLIYLCASHMTAFLGEWIGEDGGIGWIAFVLITILVGFSHNLFVRICVEGTESHVGEVDKYGLRNNSTWMSRFSKLTDFADAKGKVIPFTIFTCLTAVICDYLGRVVLNNVIDGPFYGVPTVKLVPAILLCLLLTYLLTFTVGLVIWKVVRFLREPIGMGGYSGSIDLRGFAGENIVSGFNFNGYYSKLCARLGGLKAAGASEEEIRRVYERFEFVEVLRFDIYTVIGRNTNLEYNGYPSTSPDGVRKAYDMLEEGRYEYLKQFGSPMAEDDYLDLKEDLDEIVHDQGNLRNDLCDALRGKTYDWIVRTIREAWSEWKDANRQ